MSHLLPPRFAILTLDLRTALFALLLLTFAARTVAAESDPITPEEATRGFRARTLLAKPRADLGAVQRAEATQRIKLLRTHARLGGLRTLETDGTEDVEDVIARLKSTGLYDYIEPDYIRRIHALPNDPRFAADQWSLDNTGQAGGTAGADIRAAAGWEVQREAPDVIVAVMDTGVRLDHEDLNANLWRNTVEFGARPNTDDDNNGYLDDVFGINATLARTHALAGEPWDEDGHGSHVAGIIGGVGDNGKGITGVAWKVQIMPLKFLGQRGGTVSAAVACIDYAIAKKAHIINGSYGSIAYSQAEFDAIKRARDAGIIFVASAGNDSQEINNLPEYPAAYPLDNIVAVASTTRQDKLASYSTYGSGMVELAAPGSSVLSLSTASPTGLATKSGTSMAAPHVSGALALLKQKFPNDNYRALINRLLSSVDAIPALDHKVHTNGRLNLLRALSTTETRPFNDDFARRAVITGTFNSARSSNQYATNEPTEPDHGVAGTTGSLWWSWTAPVATGKATISTAGSGIDTVLAIYLVPAAGSTAPLQRIGFNDDASATATTSSVSFDTVSGATYAIAIAGKGGTEGLVTFNLLTVPTHDLFSRAFAISGASAVLDDNNNGATGETGEPRPRNTAGREIGNNKTLWYRWVAPASRSYQISVHGVVTDPVTAVYSGPSLTELTQVALDDDGGPGLDSLVRLNASAGGTYYICVDSFSASGQFTLSIADAAWQYVADDELPASPALAPDGTIYLPSSFGFLHALNPDGSRKWRSTAISGFIASGGVAVGADGTIYAVDDLGYVHALNPVTGARKWRFDAGDASFSTAPALAADGTVYVKSDDGQLHALDAADGTRKWQFAVPGDTYSSPVVAADGTVYLGSGDDSALYAINPDGTLKWRAALGSTVYASPALGADGTIYLGNYDGRFFAIRPDGTERWRFDTNSPLSASAVIDARGVVYFGSYDRKLYALDAATGVKKWDYATGDTIRSTTPILADDGTIFIGGDDGLIHAVNPDGTLRRTYATGGDILTAPMIDRGRLYVASMDSKFYAFDIGANLARAPWPMHRHNLRRTARTTEFPGIPVFNTQPVAATGVAAGTSTSISAAATLAGGASVTYQWLFNDVAIPGATAATLALPSAQGSSAGIYRVLAIGTGGSVISQPTTLTVAAGDASTARLVNLAVRSNAGSGDRVLFMGFAVGGAGTSGNKPLLIRGVGPTLGVFGVTGTLADPRLQIFDGPTLLLENDDWAGNVAVATISPQVGAFTLASAASKDAALFSNRPAGSYTAQISGAGTENGIVLAEIYDATPTASYTAATPRLVNVSARTNVGTGGNILIAGFVIGGIGTKNVLIRAIGPTLGLFGVGSVLADPRLELFLSGSDAAIATNDNWGAATNAQQVVAAAAGVGAFALALESKDAVLLLTLQPGNYTAQISGINNTTGASLVEVYEVP